MTSSLPAPPFSSPWCGISLSIPSRSHSLLLRWQATAAGSAAQATCKGPTAGGVLTRGRCELSKGQLRDVMLRKWPLALENQADNDHTVHF